jgi:EF hand
MSRISKTRNTVLIICAMLALFAVASLPRTAAAQKADKGIPKQIRTLNLGEGDVRDLLLLMDTDKNGKISKKEFLDFMSAEFDRLDKDKSGELDPKELTQSQIRPAARAAAGK